MRIGVALALGAALAGVPMTTAAQSTHARPAESAFWRGVRLPGLARARLLQREGRLAGITGRRTPDLASVLRARMQGSLPRALRPLADRQALRDAAVRRLEQAARLAPGDREILFDLAMETASWEHASRPRRVDEAMERFGAVRALDPDYRAADVAFELGIMHTRRHEFAQAAREYDMAVRLAMFDPATRITGLSNWAEVTMMTGDVRRSVVLFEIAIDAMVAVGGNPELMIWGLAVARDRTGDHRGAIQSATEAMALGGGSMDALHSPDVFFEPAHELAWYQALGHEAQAEAAQNAPGPSAHRGARQPSAREAHLRGARLQWRRFLSGGGADSRWASAARERLAAVESLLAAPAPSARPVRPRVRGQRSRN